MTEMGFNFFSFCSFELLCNPEAQPGGAKEAMAPARDGLDNPLVKSSKNIGQLSDLLSGKEG